MAIDAIAGRRGRDRRHLFALQDRMRADLMITKYLINKNYRDFLNCLPSAFLNGRYVAPISWVFMPTIFAAADFSGHSSPAFRMANGYCYGMMTIRPTNGRPFDGNRHRGLWQPAAPDHAGRATDIDQEGPADRDRA